MGNRASVVFFDSTTVSPTIYLHWHGDSVPDWLEELAELMKGRYGDASYAAARFVGICHKHIQGNLSLGLLSGGYSRLETLNPKDMAASSPGDAGMVVVNSTDFSWRAYGGYLTEYTDEGSHS